jgi:hypothetical protein
VERTFPIIGVGAGGPELGLMRAGIEETANRIKLSKVESARMFI